MSTSHISYYYSFLQYYFLNSTFTLTQFTFQTLIIFNSLIHNYFTYYWIIDTELRLSLASQKSALLYYFPKAFLI